MKRRPTVYHLITPETIILSTTDLDAIADYIKTLSDNHLVMGIDYDVIASDNGERRNITDNLSAFFGNNPTKKL